MKPAKDGLFAIPYFFFNRYLFVSNLTSAERVDHIIEKIEFYGYSGDRVRGLVFCRRIEEAQELSRLFNEKGLKSLVISSQSDMIFNNEKISMEEAIELLEQEDRESGLDYIFTVDMFNEGIDIPSVNQIIMLRPTKSPIVFVQQLGRGLRKCEGKEYLVVLDFIGNYSNNFMIPIALSGDRSYNKDNLRKYILEGSRLIPGCSTIHFDAVAKEKIFSSIDGIKGIRKIIKESYANLKKRLGYVPSLVDFYENGEVDPLLIIDEYKSYINFLQGIESTYKSANLSKEEKVILEYLSRIIAKGIRPHESEMLRCIIEDGHFTKLQIKKSLSDKYDIVVEDDSVDFAIKVLQGAFTSNATESEKYSKLDIMSRNEKGLYERMFSYSQKLENMEFQKQVNDLLELGTRRYKDIYATENERGQFALYRKYSRRDVCQLLNWGKDFSSTMYGMKRIDDDVALFVTYNKALSADKNGYVEGKPDYADKFEEYSRKIFMWDSQIGKGPESPYMQDVCGAKRKHLFIKKNDAEGVDFYYIGLVDILDIKADKKRDKNNRLRPITKVKFKLHDPVREDIKDYLESN